MNVAASSFSSSIISISSSRHFSSRHFRTIFFLSERATSQRRFRSDETSSVRVVHVCAMCVENLFVSLQIPFCTPHALHSWERIHSLYESLSLSWLFITSSRRFPFIRQKVTILQSESKMYLMELYRNVFEFCFFVCLCLTNGNANGSPHAKETNPQKSGRIQRHQSMSFPFRITISPTFDGQTQILSIEAKFIDFKSLNPVRKWGDNNASDGEADETR